MSSGSGHHEGERLVLDHHRERELGHVRLGLVDLTRDDALGGTVAVIVTLASPADTPMTVTVSPLTDAVTAPPSTEVA